MTTLATIRAAIKAKLVSITDIGVVNDYERYTDQMSDLKTFYVATISGSPQLRGWHIRRTRKREIAVDTGRWSVHNEWRIRGFMALHDGNASEKTFDDLVEAVCDAFRSDDSLGGAVFSSIDPQSAEAGLQLVESRPVLFAGALCHNVELKLNTQHLL